MSRWIFVTWRNTYFDGRLPFLRFPLSYASIGSSNRQGIEWGASGTFDSYYYTNITILLLLYYCYYTTITILLLLYYCYYTTVTILLLLYYYYYTTITILLLLYYCYYTTVTILLLLYYYILIDTSIVASDMLHYPSFHLIQHNLGI